jgi:hypothetical protein
MLQQNPDLLRNMLTMSGLNNNNLNNIDDATLQQMIQVAFNPTTMRNMMQMERQLQQMGFVPPTTNVGDPNRLNNNPWGNHHHHLASSTLNNPWAAPSSTATASNNSMSHLDFSNLLSSTMFPSNSPNHSMAGARALTTSRHSDPSSRLYTRQMEQLRDMGFGNDNVTMHNAVEQAHGNLNRAVEILLSTAAAASPPVASQAAAAAVVNNHEDGNNHPDDENSPNDSSSNMETSAESDAKKKFDTTSEDDASSSPK